MHPEILVCSMFEISIYSCILHSPVTQIENRPCPTAEAPNPTSTSSCRSKAKDKNPAIEKPPFFDFGVLKSRTVQILITGTAIAAMGISSPMILFVSILPAFSSFAGLSLDRNLANPNLAKVPSIGLADRQRSDVQRLRKVGPFSWQSSTTSDRSPRSLARLLPPDFIPVYSAIALPSLGYAFQPCRCLPRITARYARRLDVICGKLSHKAADVSVQTLAVCGENLGPLLCTAVNAVFIFH